MSTWNSRRINRENVGEALFKEIMVDNFPELKRMELQIQEAQRIPNQTYCM